MTLKCPFCHVNTIYLPEYPLTVLERNILKLLTNLPYLSQETHICPVNAGTDTRPQRLKRLLWLFQWRVLYTSSKKGIVQSTFNELYQKILFVSILMSYSVIIVATCRGHTHLLWWKPHCNRRKGHGGHLCHLSFFLPFPACWIHWPGRKYGQNQDPLPHTWRDGITFFVFFLKFCARCSAQPCCCSACWLWLTRRTNLRL